MCNSNRECKKVVTVPLFNKAIIAKANSERIFINHITEKRVETVKNTCLVRISGIKDLCCVLIGLLTYRHSL